MPVREDPSGVSDPDDSVYSNLVIGQLVARPTWLSVCLARSMCIPVYYGTLSIPYLISHNSLLYRVRRHYVYHEGGLICNVSCMLAAKSGFWSFAKQY
jgi:hypothetical protein